MTFLYAGVSQTDFTLDAAAQTCTFPLGDGVEAGDVIRVRYPYRRGLVTINDAVWAEYIATLSPSSWHRFEEAGTATAVDSSGNGRDCTTVTFTAGTLAGATADAINDAQLFDGVDDVAAVTGSGVGVGDWPKTGGGTAPTFSVAMFVKFTTAGFAAPLSIRDTSGTDGGITVVLTVGRTAGHVGAETWAHTNVATRCISDSAINDDAWHLVVATYNSAGFTLNLYVDGVLHDTKGQVAANITNTTRTFNVGANRSGVSSWVQWFPGGVDEVLTFGQELSAAEVATMWERAQ